MVLKMPKSRVQELRVGVHELVGPFHDRIFCDSVLVCNKASPFSFQVLTILMKLSPSIRKGMFVKIAKW